MLSAQEKVDTILIVPNIKINTSSINTESNSKEEIDVLPSQNILDLLAPTSGVNVQQRGFLGSQADISIRGGSYEQVALFFNGIKINNPQTGHNNMLFPFDINTIDRVDVIKTGSSKYFGANAYTGAISFSTKKPKKTSTTANFSLGSFQTVQAGISQNISKKKHWHKLSASTIQSNGYRANTDNETYQVFSENHFTVSEKANLDAYATFGFHSKKFGANSFYTLRFPDQYEELQSYFYNVGIKNNFFKIDGYWNQINDRFLLVRENPSFFENRHTTDVRGAQATFNSPVNENMSFYAMADFRNEHIESSNLGIRDRNIFNLNTHLDYRFSDKFITNVGANLNLVENFDQFLTGGANIAYLVNDNWGIYSSFNTAFRIPSFTELYYTSPTDSGNSELKPEHSRTFEIGTKYHNSQIKTGLNLFSRWSDNQIDWIRPNNSASYFETQNISSIQTYGVEFNFEAMLSKIINAKPIHSFAINYAYNNFDIDSIQNTRYSFQLLRHQLTSSLTLKLHNRLTHTFSLRVEERTNINYPYAILDSRTQYHFKGIPASLFIDIRNITDTDYEFFNGLPMPGIHFNSGLRFSL